MLILRLGIPNVSEHSLAFLGVKAQFRCFKIGVHARVGRLDGAEVFGYGCGIVNFDDGIPDQARNIEFAGRNVLDSDDALHILLVERLHAVVGRAQVADCQIADAQREHQQNPKAAHQPGHCIEILKPVHVFPLLLHFQWIKSL